MLAIIGVCILTAISVLAIRRYAPEYSILVSAVAGSIVLTALLVSASGLFSDIEDIFLSAGLDGDVFKLVLKCLGVCYITNFAVDLCRDFGQTSLSSKIELAGKISITIMTLPLIKQILDAAVGLVV